MVKISRLIRKLDNVTRLRQHGGNLVAEGTYPPVLGGKFGSPRQKRVKILDARPGGRAIVRGTEIPAVGRRKIHGTASGENALGDEIGAIPTRSCKIGEKRIA